MLPPIKLKAQWGIGDTLMHRAVIRELMKTRDVYLHTHLPGLFVDLIGQGLKISSCRPDARPPLLSSTSNIAITAPPDNAQQYILSYTRNGPNSILSTGSVLASQFKSVGLPMPEAPDLRFASIPEEWRERARKLIAARPFMIARPIVVHGYYAQPMRNPDPAAYTALYESIRRDFFTFGVANIHNGRDIRVGPELTFDAACLKGELDLETMVGLFAEADLVFTPLCFAPWLALATTTPLVTVFGGVEGQATTIERPSKWSPTLAIESDNQCNCHNRNHLCNKAISVDKALPQLHSFAAQHVKRSSVKDARLALPDVTLVSVETQVHELARRAIADTVSKAKFGDVLIYTDKPDAINIAGARHMTIPNWPDKIQMGAFYYSEAAHTITTSHALLMEWDACIRDVSMWDSAFLEYDYIGAPWLPHCCKVKGLTVGNGGFALVSKRLADYIYVNKHRLPVNTDIAIAQFHRPEFEQAIGAKWAPEDVARRFAYELGQQVPSFGVHGLFNWHLALDKSDILSRARLVAADSYGRTKMNLLTRGSPWVTDALKPVQRDSIGRQYVSSPNMIREMYLRQRQPGVRA